MADLALPNRDLHHHSRECRFGRLWRTSRLSKDSLDTPQIISIIIAWQGLRVHFGFD